MSDNDDWGRELPETTAGRVGTQGTTRMLTGEIDENGHHKSVPVVYEGAGRFPWEGEKAPRDFTAEKDIYARVYGAKYADCASSIRADQAGKTAVQDMMKFFNELQEKP